MSAPRALSGVLAACMAAQSILGLLFPGQYRDPAWIRAAWFANDWITLLVAAPLLVGALAQAGRGSTRARLVWTGCAGYAAYNYAFYLLGAALNVFFPLYVVALVLAIGVLVLLLSRMDAAGMAAGVPARWPGRLVAGYLIALGIGLATVWLVLWGAYAFAGRATPVEPEAFKVVAALDLSLMVPALMLGGILLWRGKAWGQAVAAIVAIQGALYLLVLSVGASVAIRRGLVEAPGELPLWGTLAVMTAAAALVLLIGVRDRPAAAGSRS